MTLRVFGVGVSIEVWNESRVMDWTRQRFLDNLWRWAVGVPEREQRTVPLEKMIQTQLSKEFERLMRNRLLVGGYRYGMFGEPGKPMYDSVAAARKHLDEYIRTGNLEHLVDAANLCLVEFIEGQHPLRHFEAIDDGQHTEISNVRR